MLTFKRSPDQRFAVWLAAAAFVGLVTVAGSASAQAQNAPDFGLGLRIWTVTGNCQQCHGWFADGLKMDNQMPDGANLHDTQLGREDLIMTVKCGRPAGGMPAFEKDAYKDGHCYGMTAADLKAAGVVMYDMGTLRDEQIEAVVDFILAKFKGKPLNKAACIDMWGGDRTTCRDLP